jgi:hypothetical protein
VTAAPTYREKAFYRAFNYHQVGRRKSIRGPRTLFLITFAEDQGEIPNTATHNNTQHCSGFL